jgi:hypothetical protein
VVVINKTPTHIGMYKLSRILEFKIFEHDKDLYIFAFVYFRIYEDNEFKVDHSQFSQRRNITHHYTVLINPIVAVVVV